MKFLSLKNPKVVTFLLSAVLAMMALSAIYTMVSIVLLQFIVPFSFILIIHDVLLVSVLMYEDWMPDRYWKWEEQGYNGYKIKIITSLVYLAYSAMVIFVYWDEFQVFLPERFR